MAINEQYARELHTQFGYLATWLPTLKIGLGEVGVIRDGMFERVGNLDDFGIKHTDQVSANSGDLDYTSAGAVSVDFGAVGSTPVAATVPAKIEANISISFGRADAVLFQAAGCNTSTITNLREISDIILSRYKAGNWPEEHVVVTEVISCEAATILVSSGANAHVNLTASGELGSGSAKLARAGTGLKIAGYSAIGASVRAGKGATPLFKAVGIRKPWLPFIGRPTIEVKAGEDMEFAPIGYEALVGPRGERDGRIGDPVDRVGPRGERDG
jgi:hypothetical protein